MLSQENSHVSIILVKDSKGEDKSENKLASSRSYKKQKDRSRKHHNRNAPKTIPIYNLRKVCSVFSYLYRSPDFSGLGLFVFFLS